ncbi:hypothetical protein [Embleya sp. NPDC020886]|uniref:hypothetical protein n=1 Tax=Embleya sp. NPDC020886 TaxID=3363980 RepID=UPI00379735E4
MFLPTPNQHITAASAVQTNWTEHQGSSYGKARVPARSTDSQLDNTRLVSSYDVLIHLRAVSTTKAH